MAYTKDNNGFITFQNVPLSKSGVFPYLGKSISPELDPEKVYWVYRPESELNNPETIESFKLSPWIPRHEMLGEKYTPAEDVGVEGVTGESVYYQNGALYANLKLFGESLKNAIKNGLKELSCGFACLWEIGAGTTPEGVKYDVTQKRIRGNHLASVPQGRMGSEVSVAMDRATFALDNLDLNKPDGENMTIEELAALMAKQGEQISAMSTAMDEMSKDMKAKKAEDMEKEKEKKAMEDDAEGDGKTKAEDKDKEKGGKAMDAEEIVSAMKTVAQDVLKPVISRIDAIESNAQDASEAVKSLGKKNDLADKASAIVGAFDHSEMDLQGVAKYALEKIGVAFDEGQEVAILNGYLAARNTPKYTIDNTAQDGADKAGLSDALDKAGF